MDQQQKREEERIRNIVHEAQRIQAKRTMKTLAVLTAAFFAVQGMMAVYHFFLLWL